MPLIAFDPHVAYFYGKRSVYMPTAAPCAIVIFGASGDLAKRKLIPALYELAREKLISEHSVLIGYARSEMSDDEYQKDCKEAIIKFARTKPVDTALVDKLLKNIGYVQGNYDSKEDFQKLADRLAKADKDAGTAGNRMFYLSTPPNTFDPIITNLGEQAAPGEGKFRRIVIEKPFGRDLKSAQSLNAILHKYFDESDVFRIDHYLGKETVQNLMVMRFANTIFEPIWSSKYIDHVQITVSETLGVGKRGGYYDKSGAMRDMVQNHLFQLLALVAMEPPCALDAVSIRDEKVKVFRSIRRLTPEHVDDFIVRGQYGAGESGGEKTDGYLKEKDVPADSPTETFVAAKLYIDNWRWSGTPFYLRTGKTLKDKLSEVVVRFRSPPLTLFQKKLETAVYPNDLIIRIQPEEGISWRMNGKVPGGALCIKPIALDMLYKTTFNVEPPEAYERLIFDAMTGDQTLFIRGDEAEAAWRVVDPIELGWSQSKNKPQEYKPGSWGPQKAFDLIERDGRRWLHTTDKDEEPIVACAL